jgi:predicted MFS family arabinose efflux permease
MLPKLAEEFGASVAAASSVITTYAFAYAASLLMQGPLGDRYGKLRVVTFGMALAGVASLGCALAWDLPSLAGMRLVTGMFASASVALGMAYIGDVVPMSERQATIAHFIAGSMLGQMLGPLVGGALTDWVGWRGSFLLLGAVFLCVAAVLLLRTRPWPAALEGAFRPLAVYRGLWERRAMRWLLGVGITETFFFFGAFAFLGAFLKERFDVSFTVLGLILAGFGAGGLAYSLTARVFIRRLGERGMVSAGGLLGAALFIAVLIMPDLAWTLPCTVGLGLAFYLIHNTIQAKATEIAPDARGSAVALYATGWALGQALGVAAIGLIVAGAGYAPAIVACGIGFGILGLWLSTNLHRLRA